MIKHILALMTMIAPIYGFCGSVYYGMYTDHMVPGQFNEVNRVVMAQFDGGLTVGSMVNSYGRDSIMFGYVQDNNKTISFGVIFATGYQPVDFYMQDYIKSSPLVPFPVVSISLNLIENVSVTANYISGVVFNSGVRFEF